MNTQQLTDICEAVKNKLSNDSISSFFSVIEKIPSLLAQSSESFQDKLQTLEKCDLFSAIVIVLRNPIPLSAQMTLLKFLDFLISTASSSTELNFLFSNEVAHSIILYPYEFSSIDILQSYVTVLKGISLKAKDINIDLLFISTASRAKTENQPSQEKKSEADDNLIFEPIEADNQKFMKYDCPLYSHSFPFINYNDSVTLSAARCVVLTLCLLKSERMKIFISEKSSHSTIERLVETADADGFAFIADFLTVAPKDLVSVTLQFIKRKLERSDYNGISYAASFLVNSPARSILMEIISEKIKTYDINSPIALGLLLFALEKKLILIDSAISCNLFSYPSNFIPSFSTFKTKIFPNKEQYINSDSELFFCSDEQKQSNEWFSKDNKNITNYKDLRKELENILREKSTVVTVAIILQIFKIISPNEIPSVVLEVHNQICRELKENLKADLISTFILPSDPRSRTDLDFVREIKQESIPVQQKLLFQLSEFQRMIKKWQGKNFHWFELPQIESNENFSFVVNDDQILKLTPQTLEIVGTKTYKIDRLIFLMNDSKAKKTIHIRAIQEPANKRSSLVLLKKDDLRFSFQNLQSAVSFESTVRNYQLAIMNKLIDSLIESI